MTLYRIFIGSLFLLMSGFVFADTVNLEVFESLSSTLKSKQNVVLQDETPLKVIPQYNQPQRKIQSTTEASESSLSTE